MANIRIDLGAYVVHGQTVTFRSPADCSQVDGLVIYYPNSTKSEPEYYTFVDAHGNNVKGVSLFSGDVLVKVILDTETNRAFVQNADTNAYIEKTFVKKSTPFIVTVSGSWTEDATNGGYYKTVGVEGILESDTTLVDVVLGDNLEENEKSVAAWACVTRVTTHDNHVKLWANINPPNDEFTIQLKVV